MQDRPQPGLALDRLIAETIGIEWQTAEDALPVQCDGSPDVTMVRNDVEYPESWGEFHPSTDWNDAMVAAEGSRLLNKCALEQRDSGLFCLVGVSETTGEVVIRGMSDSGPHAICLAILSLKNG